MYVVIFPEKQNKTRQKNYRNYCWTTDACLEIHSTTIKIVVPFMCVVDCWGSMFTSCSPEHAVEQTGELPVIETLWRSCDNTVMF